jgi:hypothetical protein
LFVEANRILLAASLGNAVADSNGTIRVFIDDKHSTIGANNRTWYDGLGFAPVIANYPTNMNVMLQSNSVSLSWPTSHIGWMLQSQTNNLNIGLQTDRSAWFDIPGTSNVSSISLAVDSASPSVFFRLKRP